MKNDIFLGNHKNMSWFCVREGVLNNLSILLYPGAQASRLQ